MHRDPDEMLSWHRYQSPYACPSPVPDVQEGGMCCSGRSPLFLPVFAPPRWRRQTTTAIRHVKWRIWSLCFVSGAFVATFSSEGLPPRPLMLRRTLYVSDKGAIIARSRGKTREGKIRHGGTHPCSDTWVAAIRKTQGRAFT